MKRCAGNLSKAAREADIARHHLRDLLKKRGLYGVSYDDAPQSAAPGTPGSEPEGDVG